MAVARIRWLKPPVLTPVCVFAASDAGKFISITLLSLMTMLRLELPHVNVLSKVRAPVVVVMVVAVVVEEEEGEEGGGVGG